MVFLRTHLADADRARLLAQSESSVMNLQRLQAQMVHSEKLVSLGQLAAGAAHEINNPLTAILGYSDLLADDHTSAGTDAGNGGENSRTGAADEEPGAESLEFCAAGTGRAHAAGYQHGGDERGAVAGAGSA